jgi:drug/metabolite transporter (DMT)-like permease
MNNKLILGIIFGMLASVNLSVGKGVQKMKVQVLKQGRKILAPAFRKDFGIWLLGVAMTTSASILYSVSLKFTGKSTIVASLSGIGLVGLLIFAGLVLKEKVGVREISGLILIIMGTALISYFNEAGISGRQYDITRFIYACLGMALFFSLLVLTGTKIVRMWGFAFGMIAGSLIGLGIVLGDMALVSSGGDLWGQLNGPFPYLAYVCLAGALAVTQVAFFKSTAVIVVPTINSFTIFAPLVVEYFTFGSFLTSFQYFGVLLIVAGIVILSTGQKQIFNN